MSFQEKFSALQQLFQEQKFRELIEAGEELLDDHSDQGALYLLLGKACMAIQAYGDAEYHFLKAKSLDSKNTESLFLLASLKLNLGELTRAEVYYENILSIDSGNVEAMTSIADIYFSSGQQDAAIAQYQKAIDAGASKKLKAAEFAVVLYKTASAYLALRDLENGISFIEKNAPDGFQEMVVLAKRKLYIAMGMEKQDEVLACTEELHKNVPQQPVYALELASQLINELHTERKEQIYSNCLKLELTEAQKIQALSGRAAIYTLQEKWNEALADYNSLLEIQEDWYYYQKRSQVKEALKDAKGAVQDITQAMKLYGEPTSSLLEHRGLLLMRAGATDKAIADFTALLKLSSDDNDADTYYNLGIAYHKSGEKENAVKMLLRAEILGHEKAGELLLKNFSPQLAAVRKKTSSNYLTEFQEEFDRNQRSPILSKAFGQLWLPDMYKFLLTTEEEMKNFPGNIFKKVLELASQDMLLLTPQGLLFFEGDEDPIEAYYKVEIESEHSVLLEIQPTKGGYRSFMRLGFHEENLMMTYPVTEVEVPAKYFLPTTELSDDQKTRLKAKKLDLPYLDAIEQAIVKLTVD